MKKCSCCGRWKGTTWIPAKKCTRADALQTKEQMAHKILKMVGYGRKNSIYSLGNFSREEMYAIYSFVRTHK